jgi:OmpA-OmpF porin, OOP family
MPMRNSKRTLMMISALFLLSSCVGQETRGKASGIETIIKNARNNGAYTCAPKELALAEAHLRRTNDELDLGNLLPAKDHLAIAEENARLAFKNSPPEKCAPKGEMPKTQKDTDHDGIYDDVDKCPAIPEDKDGFEDEDGCPDPDNDNDGIADASDKCPNVAEDKDGFEDEDGCPDPDNDNDGIADGVDSCPSDPEDVDGFQDQDGCPDKDNDADTVADLEDKCPNQAGPVENGGCPVQQKYKLVVVTDQKIELKQTIHFATNKTRILPVSFPLLNDVALALKDHPTINVRIEGHTDSRGNDDYNLQLSQGRASSVRSYLLGRGIAAERMEAIGYGETRPIATDQTRSGRAMNRRVEFFITKQ